MKKIKTSRYKVRDKWLEGSPSHFASLQACKSSLFTSLKKFDCASIDFPYL